MLQESQADFNVQTSQELMALYWARQECHKESVGMLLERQADLYAETS